MANDPPERVAASKVASSNANGRGSPMIGKLVNSSSDPLYPSIGIITKQEGKYYYVKWMDEDLIELAYVKEDIQIMSKWYNNWETQQKNDRIIR